MLQLCIYLFNRNISRETKHKVAQACASLVQVLSPDKWRRLLLKNASAVKFGKSNMRKNNRIFIQDLFWPGAGTTAVGSVGQQGTRGNCATVGQRQRRRRREGERVHREGEKDVVVRVGTLNLGTMTGKRGNWLI